MKLKVAIITLITIFTSSIMLADTIDILYNTDTPIAGFQFNVDGVEVFSASGGAADAAGFMISSSAGIVLGFSLSGTIIPAGSGVLVVLEVTDDGDACLTGLVISDSSGNAMDATVEDCLTITCSANTGCTDMDACNYDADATVDDDSCTYVEENYDCEGNCTAVVDCAGDCGGSAMVDECSVCDGDAANDCVQDCNGVWGGTAELDECGVCEGDGSSCDPVSLSFSNVTQTSLDMMMDNPMPVAGFQMELPGININSISGGTSAEAEFSVSASGSILVGFSLAGATISPGNAVLFSIEFSAEGDEVCFQNVVISDPYGIGTDIDIGDCADIGAPSVPWDGDACTMDDNSIHLRGDGAVLYNTLESVAGFQFDVDGASIVSAAGGASEDAGFTISANETTVLGFSLDGSTFDGCGTMINLELDGMTSGLSGIIISNAAGEELPFTYFDEEVDCPSGIYDCAGVCDGSAGLDECGICNGDGSSCAVYIESEVETAVDETILENPDFEDNFESFIESSLDLPEQTVEVINVEVLSDSRVDVQVLIEFTITLTQEEWDNTNFESENAIEMALEDVENNIGYNGIEFIDGCTVPDACNYDPDATVNDGSCLEANIMCWNGSYECDESDCPNAPDECVDDPTVCIFQAWQYDYDNQGDCEENDGIWSGYLEYFGTSCSEMVIYAGCDTPILYWMVSDLCPVSCDSCICYDYSACNYEEQGSCEYPVDNYDCDGNCTVEDCAGVCGGDAVLSGCDNTCNSTAVEDCAGVCGGDAVISGCDNTCNSTAVEDCAGVCEGNAVLSGCDNTCNSTAIEDCAGVCGGDAVLSGCDNTCNSTAVEDCTGVCGGDAVISGCDNICNSTAIEDCVGICGGSSIDDECGVCMGNGCFEQDCETWSAESFDCDGYNLGDLEFLQAFVDSSNLVIDPLTFGTQTWSNNGRLNILIIQNMFNGTDIGDSLLIPENIGNMDSLISLVIQNNASLIGSIPEGIGNLTQLTVLDVEGNSLTGEIPDTLSNLVNLTKLKLKDNQFIGAIPESLCNLDFTMNWSSITYFTIKDNYLCPPYPDCMADYIDYDDQCGRFATDDEDDDVPVACDSCELKGCTDSDACNYFSLCSNSDYVCEDDGSCKYPENCLSIGDTCEYIGDYGGNTSTVTNTNWDCDGDCIVGFDCNNECGGSAIIDDCGNCNGTCIMTNTNYFGIDITDFIVCSENENNDIIAGCDGVCGSPYMADACGNCSGDCSFIDPETEEPYENNLMVCSENAGIAKSYNNPFYVDFLSLCAEYNTGLSCGDLFEDAISSDMIKLPDCAGECGGEAIIDDCGVCAGDNGCLSLRELLIPADYSIYNIYPNPFNPVTNIRYGLPENVYVKVLIFDIYGNLVQTLINNYQTAGYHSLEWNAAHHSSGLYFVKIIAGSSTGSETNFAKTQKLMLVK